MRDDYYKVLGVPRSASAGELQPAYRKLARVAPHPRYRVRGRGVCVDLPVAQWEAVLSATVAVTTPGGEAKVKMPAGSSSGRRLRLRLRGQGIPNPNGTPADLYADVRIMVPSERSPREQELFEEFAKVSTFDPRAQGRRQ